MSTAAKDLKTGQIGTVDKVQTGAELPVAPAMSVIDTPEFVEVERKRSGARTVAQETQDRYTLLVRRYLTPAMVAAIVNGHPEGYELRIMRGPTAKLNDYAEPLKLWLRNRKLNRVVRLVSAEASEDGIGSLKVYRPRSRKATKRIPSALDAAERAELAKLG